MQRNLTVFCSAMGYYYCERQKFCFLSGFLLVLMYIVTILFLCPERRMHVIEAVILVGSCVRAANS